MMRRWWYMYCVYRDPLYVSEANHAVQWQIKQKKNITF